MWLHICCEYPCGLFLVFCLIKFSGTPIIFNGQNVPTRMHNILTKVSWTFINDKYSHTKTKRNIFASLVEQDTISKFGHCINCTKSATKIKQYRKTDKYEQFALILSLINFSVSNLLAAESGVKDWRQVTFHHFFISATIPLSPSPHRFSFTAVQQERIESVLSQQCQRRSSCTKCIFVSSKHVWLS